MEREISSFLTIPNSSRPSDHSELLKVLQTITSTFFFLALKGSKRSKDGEKRMQQQSTLRQENLVY